MIWSPTNTLKHYCCIFILIWCIAYKYCILATQVTCTAANRVLRTNMTHVHACKCTCLDVRPCRVREADILEFYGTVKLLWNNPSIWAGVNLGTLQGERHAVKHCLHITYANISTICVSGKNTNACEVLHNIITTTIPLLICHSACYRHSTLELQYPH